ncbi:TetR/AcrR family transcriptional regulator [Colwellia hornerae]|uniref:TetR family transcriptional regulator n=1 Tax=Colwellia hornerae TaxID=89402 RepID=A0A5C6QQD1_9GAMM|nr:TetR/AcrR family transcriptional regulator [Colwellia hornerae]TWX55763.1 TetR family transcriptional regulator [Colwellia hornerae]TWX61973.1 TetR family transcriptional regulator [Colwellia hornerae]TWX71305.1 TetR family transcriptional regulator [Colwellia hornerae]
MNIAVIKARRGRPPKIARENQDTKAELIRSGLEQLTENGFASSGIDQILKKVAVPKGSFYHYFASKEAFGQAVIENYGHYFANKLDVCLLDEAFPPLTRISNFVESAKIGMSRYQFKRGCLIGNLGQEVDLLPESFRQQLIDIFLCWQHRLATCLRAAQRQGQISASADCDRLAEYFWMGWEGAVSRAKLVQHTSPLDNYLNFYIVGLPR